METCKQVGEVLQHPSSSHPDASHAFTDPDLSHLRERIKKIMIPNLIRVFELKFAAQQAGMPPSRLLGNRPDATKIDEILNKLSCLKNDLELLRVWGDSCLKQVERAVDEVSDIKVKISTNTPHEEISENTCDAEKSGDEHLKKPGS